MRALDDVLAAQPGGHLGLRLLLEEVVELLPLGLDLEAKVVVLDGVRVGRLDFRSLRHQDGLEIRRAPYRRLVVVSRHIPRLGDGLLNQHVEVLPALVDLRLQLLHRRPLRLVEVQLLGVVALELRQIRAEIGHQAVGERVGDRLGPRGLHLVVPGLLGHPVRDGVAVVAVESVQILKGGVRPRIGRDDVLLAPVREQLLLLGVELLLELLDLRLQKLGGKAHDRELRLRAPLDVGLRDGVGDVGRELRRGALVGELQDVRLANLSDLDPRPDRSRQAGRRLLRGFGGSSRPWIKPLRSGFNSGSRAASASARPARRSRGSS